MRAGLSRAKMRAGSATRTSADVSGPARGVGGEIHYLIERPSYPAETRYYYADLDNLGSIQK